MGKDSDIYINYIYPELYKKKDANESEYIKENSRLTVSDGELIADFLRDEIGEEVEEYGKPIKMAMHLETDDDVIVKEIISDIDPHIEADRKRKYSDDLKCIHAIGEKINHSINTKNYRAMSTLWGNKSKKISFRNAWFFTEWHYLLEDIPYGKKKLVDVFADTNQKVLALAYVHWFSGNENRVISQDALDVVEKCLSAAESGENILLNQDEKMIFVRELLEFGNEKNSGDVSDEMKNQYILINDSMIRIFGELVESEYKKSLFELGCVKTKKQEVELTHAIELLIYETNYYKKSWQVVNELQDIFSVIQNQPIQNPFGTYGLSTSDRLKYTHFSTDEMGLDYSLLLYKLMLTFIDEVKKRREAVDKLGTKYIFFLKSALDNLSKNISFSSAFFLEQIYAPYFICSINKYLLDNEVYNKLIAENCVLSGIIIDIIARNMAIVIHRFPYPNYREKIMTSVLNETEKDIRYISEDWEFFKKGNVTAREKNAYPYMEDGLLSKLKEKFRALIEYEEVRKMALDLDLELDNNRNIENQKWYKWYHNKGFGADELMETCSSLKAVNRVLLERTVGYLYEMKIKFLIDG